MRFLFRIGILRKVILFLPIHERISMKSKLFTLIILTSFFSVMIISCAANESSVTRALITCSSQPFFHSKGELYKPTGMGAACFDNFFIKFNYTI